MTTGILINPFSVLKHVRPELSGRITYKGGGGSAPTDQTITQSNIPEYAEPYFMAMMDDATVASSQTYTPYGGQRIADQNPLTMQSYDMVQNVANSGIPMYDQAVAGTQGAMDAAGNIGNQLSGMADYDPYQYNKFGGFEQFDYGDPEMWNSEVSQRYMSPYIENVLDLQKQRAEQDFGRQQLYRDSEATKAGAFGGSRQAVQDALAEEAMLMNMAEIDAKGLQSAYENAGRMFQDDRKAGYQYDTAQAGENARFQDALASELARYEGAQAGENLSAAQFGNDAFRSALDAWGMTGDMANNLLGMGEADRAAYIQGAQLLDSAGSQNQAYEQAGLDTAYQDFLAQRDWDQDQISWYSDILRGVPVSADTTSTNYTADNPLQDAMGLGISTIGMVNAV